MSTARRQISDEVLEILRECTCENNLLRLPRQLDRPTYLKVSKVLTGLGGTWNRKKGGTLFAGNAQEVVGDAVTTGAYIDAKQDWQFFETPLVLADRLCRTAEVGPGQTILEPSAGYGRIAAAIVRAGASPYCIEADPVKCKKLREDGYDYEEGDFLQIDAAAFPDLFDAVVMNPPFTKSQDIAHVMHAWDFVKPGGHLTAVMSCGFTFRGDRKATAFTKWLSGIGGDWSELPENTFKESGTLARTVLIWAEKK